MAEAKKMMDNPEFQKQMKNMAKDPQFKESIEKTKEQIADPNKAAHMEAKMEHMLKVGNDKLKQGAAASMEDAMAAMNNPEVLSEMTKMLKDPNFKKELEAMQKDPQFASYIDAMKDMMKDPAKKRQIDAVSDTVRASL
jgi:mannitol/fructose-specific phosphotransferase system IIA component (Ntr-type)